MLTKVIIADDHQLICMALKTLIDLQPEMQCVACCSSLTELASSFESCDADVAICDLNFGTENALPFIRQATGAVPTKFIVSSAYPSEVYAPLCWAAGAAAFVNKSSDSQSLIECVRRVISEPSSKLVIDPTSRAAEPRTSFEEQSGERLSNREWQVFLELGNGSSTEEIAAKLFLSPKTIESHRVNIKRKLTISSKDKLVSVASKVLVNHTNRLVDLDRSFRKIA